MTAPSNEAFANEIKSDRLRILYQITLLFCGFVLTMVLTFGIAYGTNNQLPQAIFFSMVAFIMGSLLADQLLRRDHLTAATWAFSAGIVTGVSVLMFLSNDPNLAQIMPFTFPVIIIIVGLLISPTSTFTMASITTIITLLGPSFFPMAGSLGVHQFAAVALMFVAAGLAAQVTGELYAITEWALMNYQRERRTNDELFDKRRELQKSLKRSEALSDELRDINSELESARQQAEEAKHFRGQFLANMSHELRTPLNAIIGFSETMLQFPVMYDNESLPTAYERDLGQIYNSGRQLLYVINDILDLAKVDAGRLEIHLEPVEAKPLIDAVVSTAKGLLGGKPVQLEKDLPERLPTVWADESRLRQVLLNLYSNATKYTDEGFIRLTVQEQGDHLLFAVQDTGMGIPEAFHQDIFEEFKQAKAAGRDTRSGTGLGLAITRQLLDLMGGRIWLESEVGQGSTFYFTIPVYRGQDRNVATSDQAPDTVLES